MQPRQHTDRHAPTGADGAAGDPLVGRFLDRRYRITGRIARGGMASVYEAVDVRLDRVVAIKIMHAGLGDDDEFAARFVREARAAARLSHPNVVAVYDQGEEDGTVYLAMELVSGHTLRDVIRKESPMPPAKALALIEPVLSALAAAHRAGLIHRDVKPENVLIADEPGAGGSRIKVADFGLAKAVSADTQHTATSGVLIGTVSYLAPELVVDGRADPRADVYAAGVMLYELLTGRKPHEGESPIQVAYKHVHEDVPAPSRAVPGIPAYVDALVARATARERDLRPADAAVLLHQVHRVSHALADGVAEDPELTADLAPLVHHREDTRPDPYDEVEMAALLQPAPAGRDTGAERTSLIPRSTPPPPRPPARRTDARPPGGGRPRRRRGPLLLALLLVVAVVAGAGAWWFGWARYTSAPAVLGLARSAAFSKLESAGLDPALGDPAYSETVPAGRVLSTDPDAGSRVLDGGTVTVVLSLGKERYDVPKVKGKDLDRAQDAVTAAHLTPGREVRRYSETVPEGVVLGSDPKAGTSQRPGTAVQLFVSKGPRPIHLRDWTGKSADRAQSKLEGKGLTVDRSTEEFSDSYDKGEVISQEPPGGVVHRGDTVRLVVSKGPELVQVPDGLRASGLDDAKAKLEALGFKVDVENSAEYLGLGYVLKTSPSSGDMVPVGSTIILYLI